jgi:hypothetical protein
MSTETGGRSNSGGTAAGTAPVPENQPSSNTGRRYQGRRGGLGSTLGQGRFDGRCEALKGHVYDCRGGQQPDQYVKTTKELAVYVGQTFKQGSEIEEAIKTLELQELTQPKDPGEKASAGDKKLWETRLTQFVKREEIRSDNIKTLYSLVWGQCSDAMQERLMAHPDYSVAQESKNGIELLKCVKTIMYNYQSHQAIAKSLHEAKRRFYMLSQGKFQTPQAYLEQFTNNLKVIEYLGGEVGLDPVIVKRIADGKTPTAEHKKQAKEETYAMALFLGADRA